MLNIVPRSHALVRTEINFLCRSLDRPTIEESFSNMQIETVEKSRDLARVIKAKENKHENQKSKLRYCEKGQAYRTSETKLISYALAHEIWVQDLAKVHFS